MPEFLNGVKMLPPNRSSRMADSCAQSGDIARLKSDACYPPSRVLHNDPFGLPRVGLIAATAGVGLVADAGIAMPRFPVTHCLAVPRPIPMHRCCLKPTNLIYDETNNSVAAVGQCPDCL